MVPIEGKKQLIILRCSSCFDLEAEKKANIPTKGLLMTTFCNW